MPWAGQLVVAAALALFPLLSHALGLGKLKVHSALNEPLNADIEFASISEKELKGLSASLAARSEFEAAGVDRLPYLSLIKFTVAKRLDGRYFLHLHTDQQINEPFLHLMLQLEWPGGRLVREYTALIDPPYHVAGKPADIQAPETAPSARIEPAPIAPKPMPLEPVATAPEVKVEPVMPAAAETPPAVAEPAAEATKPAEVAMTEGSLLGPPEIVGGEAPASPAGWPEDQTMPKVEPLGPATRETATATEELAPAVSGAVPSWSNTSEYAVKRGDTLWQIAEKVRVDTSLSMEQVILAVFKANQDAFFRNNVNNLKAGKILKMPEREEVETLPNKEAHREFKAQYDVWQEYKLKLASASRAIQLADVAEPAPAPKPELPQAKPEKTAAAKPQAAPAAQQEKKPAEKKTDTTLQKKSAPPSGAKQSDELLRIVRATLEREQATPDKKIAETESTKDTSKKEQVALAEKVTTLEESIESKQMETKELGEKIGEVKSQLKKESRLIELENRNLAQTQKPAAEKPAPPVESAAPEVKSETKPEAPKPVPSAAAPVKPVKPAVRKRAAPPPPPEEKGIVGSVMSFLDDALGNSLLPAVGGVVALLGGGILLVYLRRRQRSIAEFEESILSDAISAEATTTTEDTSGQAVTTGDTSFLSDFSQGGMGNIHTDEVDPIAEAEVYLAYGRDETAEDILKEAIVKNPERQELKQKLLEIYYQRNDVGAYETLAEELYAALGGRGGQIWSKVEEMGRKLNPDNPMFRGSAAKAVPTEVAVAETDTGDASPPAMAAVFNETQVAPASGTEIVGDLDFDLGGVETAAPTSDETSFDLDFSAEAESPTQVREDAGMGSLDMGEPVSASESLLDLETDSGEAPQPDESEVTGQPAAGVEEIQWEAEAPSEVESEESGLTEESMQQQWDETATKLDLAKAYIDMGDSEGARSILDEVLSEGNESQKKQAAELATQIA